MEIKIGIVGEIVAGEETGSFIKVVDETKKSGGFLILTSSSFDMTDGFDNWVENEKSLGQCFTESGWVIRWL